MVALALAVAASGAFALPTPAAAAITCRSGATEHRAAGGVRVFRVERRGGYGQLYACSRQVRRPRLLYDGSPATDVAIGRFDTFGRRVGFVIQAFGAETGSTQIGWFDRRTGRRARVYVERELGTPVDVYVVAPDGGVAYALADDAGGQDIGWARFGARRFGAPRILATIPEGDLDTTSLTVGDGRITWRRRSGEAGAVAIP